MRLLTDLIDATTFGTVRRYLQAAHSPITSIMLVRHRDALARVGQALMAEEERPRSHRWQQWADWLNSGEVRVGGASPFPGPRADLDGIPDSAICEVLFVPPVYLVHLRDFNARPERRRLV